MFRATHRSIEESRTASHRIDVLVGLIEGLNDRYKVMVA